uniref:Uncharacterized protein n=1 Tax=Anguilla anguilla TaxID=7936 RepID=A0A0E9WDS3_ANGAN
MQARPFQNAVELVQKYLSDCICVHFSFLALKYHTTVSYTPACSFYCSPKIRQVKEPFSEVHIFMSCEKMISKLL